ncbi:MAG: hypothetical protein ACNA7W_10845 [Pseudomonadales bacterium]
MKRKKVNDSLMKDNEQYTKLRASEPDRNTPREDPSRQTAGKRGYSRPEFDHWTDAELRDHARRLEISGADSLDRAQLIERITDREIR